MTTVGYGDITPKSTEGKILAVIVMLVGIGTATLVIGAVAQRFLTPSVEHVESAEDDVLIELREIAARLGRLEQRAAGPKASSAPGVSWTLAGANQPSDASRVRTSSEAGVFASRVARGLASPSHASRARYRARL